MSSYNKLESECTSTGWLVIPLYFEVATLRHINTTWGMVTKALDMKKNVSKRLRLKCTKIARQVSHLPVSQAERMGGAAAHPISREFPATNTKLHQKQKQTDLGRINCCNEMWGMGL